jgi:hypothetical protein
MGLDSFTSSGMQRIWWGPVHVFAHSFVFFSLLFPISVGRIKLRLQVPEPVHAVEELCKHQAATLCD